MMMMPKVIGNGMDVSTSSNNTSEAVESSQQETPLEVNRTSEEKTQPKDSPAFRLRPRRSTPKTPSLGSQAGLPRYQSSPDTVISFQRQRRVVVVKEGI